jgi:hypothetical protein
MQIRLIPWILALLGLAIPLVVSGFVVWPVTVLWLLALGIIFAGTRSLSVPRAHRIAMALFLLPALFLLAFEGGWWLIPADLGWLALELTEHRRTVV